MEGDFPILINGKNTISWSSSGDVKLEITPRWRCI